MASNRRSDWDHATISDEEWPAEVAFLPFVGRRYKDGWNGHRVLLLGESHYRKAGMTDLPEHTRPFTRNEFKPLAEPGRTERWGKFWNALDRLLVGQERYEPTEAARAWERVAFVNQCQIFAGTAANHRPSATSMREGGNVVHEHVLPRLKPTVVLVLGRFTWDTLRHGIHAPSVQPYLANDVHRNGRRRYKELREVWQLDYVGGAAWMTWVYHPSWHIDTWQDRARALHHLLDLEHPKPKQLKDDA